MIQCDPRYFDLVAPLNTVHLENYKVSADDDLYHKARVCAAERMKFPTRKDLDPWEVSTGRSYYEEQVLSPNKKHEGTGVLISDKDPQHESV